MSPRPMHSSPAAPVTRVTSFRGAHSFLSNFYCCPVEYEGVMYPSAEHAFQAAKSDSPAVRRMMASVATPVAAKRLGRTLARREDWERAKEAVMLTVLRDKFTRHADLQKALCATGDADLVEGNDHGDTYWGVCRGHGLNRLGHLLMVVRAELRARQRGTPPHADDARERARR